MKRLQKRMIDQYNFMLFVVIFILTSVDARQLADGLLDPNLQPKFVENVPEALSDGFTITLFDKRTKRFPFFSNLFNVLFGGSLFRGRGVKVDGKPSGVFNMGAYPVIQETGLIDPTTGARLKTPAFGYGTSAATASWPGPTLEVKSNEGITIQWNNGLYGVKEFPFTSLNGSKTVLDTTIHWAFSTQGYTDYSIATDGIPIVTHLHGVAADEYADGNPDHWYTPGFAITGPDFGTKQYFYPNTHPAGNLWYHDHALGITRLNVNAGLAGFYFIRDDKDTGSQFNTLNLPYGDFEKAYAIQDRNFKTNGEMFLPAYPGEPFYDNFFPDFQTTFDQSKPSVLTEYFGDFMLVNGKIWPKQLVRATTYRMHLLNGCDSRYLVIRFFAVEPGATTTEGGVQIPYTIIGSDQGLFSQPVNNVNSHILTTGSRTDIVIDFAKYAGKRVIMTNVGGDIAFRNEIPGAWLFEHTDKIMAFDIDTRVFTNKHIKPDFSLDKVVYAPTSRVRRVGIFEGRDHFNRLQPLQGGEVTPNILESFTWIDPISEIIPVDSVEEWDIFNFSTGAVSDCDDFDFIKIQNGLISYLYSSFVSPLLE
jgi:spore coat protein A, manganese oxidase